MPLVSIPARFRKNSLISLNIGIQVYRNIFFALNLLDIALHCLERIRSSTSLYKSAFLG